jgi:hypothetical protein
VDIPEVLKQNVANRCKCNTIIQIFIMALSCEKLEKFENEEETTSSDTSGSPVAVTLFVIVVIIVLWIFFPTLLVMVVVLFVSLVVVYSTHAAQDVGKEEDS